MMKFRSYLEPDIGSAPYRYEPGQVGLQDEYHRSFHYLRLSVTDKCNFRCQYCLPNGYQKPANQPAELSRGEISRLVRGFTSLGVSKIRITGGEPSLRRDLPDILADLASNGLVKQIAISTNGYRLERDILSWVDAGLNAVNVSVDSLEPATFARLTGSDTLPAVLRGIEKAIDIAGLTVKINAVLHQHTDAAEIMRFLALVKHQAVTVRFIELMETGGTQAYFESEFVSSERLLQYLHRQQWQEVTRSSDAGPAREFSHPDYAGRIGVIAPYSSGFCDSCNRLRVTATGNLHTCLFSQTSQPLRDYLQTDAQLPMLQQQLIRAVAAKKSSHFLQRRDTGLNAGFSAIGG